MYFLTNPYGMLHVDAESYTRVIPTLPNTHSFINKPLRRWAVGRAVVPTDGCSPGSLTSPTFISRSTAEAGNKIEPDVARQEPAPGPEWAPALHRCLRKHTNTSESGADVQPAPGEILFY